jgi:Fe-S-cluster-containing hydrogenase component 2
MVKSQERKFVSCDPDKCVGCQICEYACSMATEKVFNPAKSRIRAIRINQLTNMAAVCRLCEEPACPRDALKQSEETGIIIVDKEACIGCGWCIEACDFGAIKLHPDRKVAIVCDRCNSQGIAQCVKWCPEEALTLVTSDMLASKARIKAVKKLFQESKS